MSLLGLESRNVADINQFIKETNAEIAKLQAKQIKEAKQVILTAYSKVVDFSPVDTGLFRNNHFVTVNSKTDETTENKRGTIKQSKEIIKRAKLMHNDTLTIQNNLKYADALEAGHSKQATAGVYGVTEELIRRHLAKRIKIK